MHIFSSNGLLKGFNIHGNKLKISDQWHLLSCRLTVWYNRQLPPWAASITQGSKMLPVFLATFNYLPFYQLQQKPSLGRCRWKETFNLILNSILIFLLILLIPIMHSTVSHQSHHASHTSMIQFTKCIKLSQYCISTQIQLIVAYIVTYDYGDRDLLNYSNQILVLNFDISLVMDVKSRGISPGS